MTMLSPCSRPCARTTAPAPSWLRSSRRREKRTDSRASRTRPIFSNKCLLPILCHGVGTRHDATVHRYQLDHVLRPAGARRAGSQRRHARLANIAPGVFSVIGGTIALFNDGPGQSAHELRMGLRTDHYLASAHRPARIDRALPRGQPDPSVGVPVPHRGSCSRSRRSSTSRVGLAVRDLPAAHAWVGMGISVFFGGSRTVSSRSSSPTRRWHRHTGAFVVFAIVGACVPVRLNPCPRRAASRSRSSRKTSRPGRSTLS